MEWGDEEPTNQNKAFFGGAIVQGKSAGQLCRVKVWGNCVRHLCRAKLLGNFVEYFWIKSQNFKVHHCLALVTTGYLRNEKIWDSLEIFLNLHNIIISNVSEDDTIFTLHDHEPACVILTLGHF